MHPEGVEVHSPISDVFSIKTNSEDDFSPEQLRRCSTVRSLHERLQPKAEHHGMEFYDDHCHMDYEWIRVPRQRDFDIFRVAVQDTKDRDDADVPLHTTAPDGRKAVMWAKMDTGANKNVINPGTLRKLLGDTYESTIQPLDDIVEINVFADYTVTPTHFVQLSFSAGRTSKAFQNVVFILNPREGEHADSDGVPNVLLGWEFLRESSMVMIDLEYHHNQVEPDAEVISDRAEDEKPKVTCILPVSVREQAKPPKPSTILQPSFVGR